MKKTKSQAIYEHLKNQIMSGGMVSGQQLPTEKQLATSFGVAVLTVRSALARLREEGLIISRRYHGTSVADGEKQGSTKSLPSRSIGLIAWHSLAQLSNPVFSRLVDGIEGVLAEAGYALEVIVANSSDINGDEQFRRHVAESKCAGWLIPVVLSPFQKKVLKQRDEPKILWHFPDDSLSAHLFEVDFMTLSFSIIEHLHRRNYKDVWIIAPPSMSTWKNMLMQFSGSKMCPEGMSLNAVSVADFKSSSSREACSRILDLNQADAFVCADDELCLGALQALQDRNLSCPEIGLIGGGDFPVSHLVTPTLTTVSYP